MKNKKHKHQDILNLRFDVKNKVEPTTLQIPLSNFSGYDRLMLADRLYGIDVCVLWNHDHGTEKLLDLERLPVRLAAKEPTIESLLEAIHEDQVVVEERLLRHRSLAVCASIGYIDAFKSRDEALKLRKRDVERVDTTPASPPASAAQSDNGGEGAKPSGMNPG